MKLLADTHVVLWSATDPQRLAASARAAIEDGANELSVSIVTVWEIAIKQSLGKLDLPEPAEQWLPEVLRRTGSKSPRSVWQRRCEYVRCLGITVIHSIGC